mmetsp:Transcript_35651/g.89541  ORF Transcript_35651/g.89541 Transcript_35651/m.89541 type:complete len:201 (-) Transcript_35651:627-1229(-)
MARGRALSRAGARVQGPRAADREGRHAGGGGLRQVCCGAAAQGRPAAHSGEHQKLAVPQGAAAPLLPPSEQRRGRRRGWRRRRRELVRPAQGPRVPHRPDVRHVHHGGRPEHSMPRRQGRAARPIARRPIRAGGDSGGSHRVPAGGGGPGSVGRSSVRHAALRKSAGHAQRRECGCEPEHVCGVHAAQLGRGAGDAALGG